LSNCEAFGPYNENADSDIKTKTEITCLMHMQQLALLQPYYIMHSTVS